MHFLPFPASTEKGMDRLPFPSGALPLAEAPGPSEDAASERTE